MTSYISKKEYANERDGALSILLFVNEEGGFLSDGLDHVLGCRSWTEEQRRLLTRLAKGTLERQIELDARIGAVSSRPVRKIKPVILNILRMGAYSLFYLSGIPAHAVCSEAVRLAKKRGLAGLSGFVNAIMRKLAGGQETAVISCPSEQDDDEQWIAKAEKYYSVPQWIIRRWIDDYSREKTALMLEGLYTERGLTARVNPARITIDKLIGAWKAAGISCSRSSVCRDEAVLFEPAGSISDMPGYNEGWFYIQNIGSIMAGASLPIDNGSSLPCKVLDLCAAPGGKATHIAARLSGDDHDSGRAEGSVSKRCVLACDQNAKKTELIRENAKRLQLTNIKTKVIDATEYDPAWQQAWDAVIADVPCSGLGVIGHKPDIKLRLKESDIGSLIPVQRAILENAVRYTKEGGFVVYSTCTADRAENDDNLKWILDRHPELGICRVTQLLPGLDQSDGFFIALIRKNAS